MKATYLYDSFPMFAVQTVLLDLDLHCLPSYATKQWGSVQCIIGMIVIDIRDRNVGQNVLGGYVFLSLVIGL